jgi:hypothetical protein
VARYDKYGPRSGGFRAPIGFTPVAGDLNKIFAVGLDSSGRVVKGNGNLTTVVGVLVIDKIKVIGDIVDVMTDGEIVEAALSDGTTAIAAGVPVYAVPASGLLSVTPTANTKIGFTVEGGVIANTRLVVRVRSNTAAS